MRALSRYFFDLRWSDRTHDDQDGTPLPNQMAAYYFAQRVIRELKKAGGYDDPSLVMIVKNEASRQVFSIPF
jgi:hypothetical protein